MITGYINSIVSKHFYGTDLENHIFGDETHNYYDGLNDKLEVLSQAGNLPIFTGFYTEYLDSAENGMTSHLDNRYVLQNYL